MTGRESIHQVDRAVSATGRDQSTQAREQGTRALRSAGMSVDQRTICRYRKEKYRLVYAENGVV